MTLQRTSKFMQGSDVAAEMKDQADKIGILQESVSSTSIKVEDFPRIAPENDDTGRISRALDSITGAATLEFPHDKILKTATNNVANKTNLRITGARLELSGTNSVAFNLVGTIDSLEIDHCWVKGDGVVLTGHKGIYCNSGQTITNFNYHHNFFMDMTVGISLNADTGGVYDNGTIEKNMFFNIVGVDPGQGYGVHASNATNVDIIGNTLDSVQRHSIYQAKGGKGNKINFNTIVNHRKGVPSGQIRAALNIIRSEGVKAEGNTFINCFDSCINIGSDNVLAFKDCKDIEVSNTTIIDPANNVPPIVIGEQVIPSGYKTDGIKIHHVNFVINSHKGGALIRFYNGFNVDIWAINVSVYNYESGIIGIELNDSYITDNTHADIIRLRDNTFDFRGTLPSLARAHQIGTKFCTGTMKIDIRNNRHEQLTDTNAYYPASAITNTNLIIGKRRFVDNIPNTSGATLAALEAEVNKLKDSLRTLGQMKSL